MAPGLAAGMGDHSDLDQQIEQLRKCEIIKESDVKILCAKAREILGQCHTFLFISFVVSLVSPDFKVGIHLHTVLPMKYIIIVSIDLVSHRK